MMKYRSCKQKEGRKKKKGMKFTHKKWYSVQEKERERVFRCLENMSAIGRGQKKRKKIGEEDGRKKVVEKKRGRER
jgi:hypothetical protein